MSKTPKWNWLEHPHESYFLWGGQSWSFLHPNLSYTGEKVNNVKIFENIGHFAGVENDVLALSTYYGL